VGSMSQKRHRRTSRSLQVTVMNNFFTNTSRIKRIRPTYAIVFAFLILVLGCRDVNRDSDETNRTSEMGVQIEPQAEKILRVATSGDYPPFSDWPTTSPKPIGFSISVAEAFALDSGRTLEWMRFRWAELSSELAAGSFDFAISGITVRPDRSIQGRFGIPLTTSGAIVLVEARSSFESANDLDRPSTRIAVNAGGHLEKVARRLFPSAQIDAISTNAAVLDQLLEKEADAVVTDSVEAPHWHRDAGRDLREIGPLTHDLKAAWFTPENKHEVDRFNRWLLEAEATGLLSRLRREHGLPDKRTARPLVALLSSLNERLSLMKAVADAKQVLGTPIENREREEVVLDAAVRAIREASDDAQTDPPDPSAIRQLFRAQIEAAKWIQSHHTKPVVVNSASTGESDRRLAQARLDDSIRPALIDLGRRISMLVLVCAEASPIPLSEDDVARALESHDLPRAQLLAIYEALSEIVSREKPIEPIRRPRAAQTNTIPSGSTQRTPP
jgi:cyclohexadienyl dehydratase